MTVYEHNDVGLGLVPDFITKSGWLTSLALRQGNEEHWRDDRALQAVFLRHDGETSDGLDRYMVVIGLDSIITAISTDRLNRARQIFHAAVMSTIEPDEYEPRLARLLEAHS